MIAGQSRHSSFQVFICHSSGDKSQVRELCDQLVQDGFDPWLDERRLLPGEDWDSEIEKAVRASGAVIVCLSHSSITKEGYVQKEIRRALDAAEEKPQGTIFLIPARLEGCEVPERLRRWQWVDLFTDRGYSSLRLALEKRAITIGAVTSAAPEPPRRSPASSRGDVTRRNREQTATQRKQNIRTLITRGTEEAWNSLKELAQHDPSTPVRKEAMKALPMMARLLRKPRPVLVQTFLEFLADPNAEMFSLAAQKLGEYAALDAVRALQVRLPIHSCRRSAAEALQKIGQGHNRDFLVTLLDDPDEDPEIRNAAVIGLGEIKHPQAMERLRSFLTDASDPKLRMAVVEGLEKLSGSNKEAIDALAGLATDDVELRRLVSAALINGEERHTPAAIRLISDSDWSVRANAARALGRIGSSQGIDALLDLMGDPDFLVKSYVSDALAEIAARRPDGINSSQRDRLLDMVKNSASQGWAAAKALATLRIKGSHEHIVRLLESDDFLARREAVEALAIAGDTELAESLLKVINDDNETVRFQVAVSKAWTTVWWQWVRALQMPHAEQPGRGEISVLFPCYC